MRILNNLLKVRVWKNSILFKEYGFSEDEVKIAKSLTSNFIKGNTSLDVGELLNDVFEARKLNEKLKYIDTLIQLREKGYIDFGTSSIFVFDQAQKLDKDKIPHLEILNSNVYLTAKFLFLLQDVEEKRFKIDIEKPYKSQFEYIEDKLKKVKSYIEISDKSRAIKLAEEIEKKIEDRVEISDIELPLRRIIVDKKLSHKEEIIFLAVLGEEYSSFQNGKNYRAIDNLIDLVSLESYERFENRSLFREDSRLIQEKLFEFETSIHFIGENKGFTNEELFISENILREIEGVKAKKRTTTKRNRLKELVEKQEIFELLQAKKDIDAIVLPKETRKILDTIIRQLDKRVIKRLVDWGIKDRRKGIDAKIIFHGVAGTGKTLTATALAKTLKKDILHFDASKILSMYVGESEKNVRNIFDTYRTIVKESGVEPILLLNEADQFLTARSTDTSSSVSQMYNQMQNIFLEQIENFEGILIATTNLLENLDKAFSRRFNYKVKFKPPSKDERVALWKIHLPKKAKFEKDFSIEKLSEFKLTGGQIDLIVKNTAFKVATKDEPIFLMEDFLKEIEREKSSSFENDKVMGFIQ